MNSETLCEICLQLIASPTILTCCYSSVCFECLRKASQKESRNNDKLYYKCPFCKKDHQTSASAKSNIFLSRYIEFCYKRGKFQNISCDSCGTKTKFSEGSVCNECGSKYFCKECNIMIHSNENIKNHTRTNISSQIKTYTGSLNKTMLCQSHQKEKIEYICLKDLTTLCKLCMPMHARTCSDGRITPLEKSHTDLATQLSNKIEQVNDYRNMIDVEYLNIRQRLEEFNRSSEEVLICIENQFKELREALDSKEKEIKAIVEQNLSKRRTILNLEVQNLDNMNMKTENLIDIVEFAMSYPNTFFCEGAKYVMSRLNRLSNMFIKMEKVKPLNVPTFDLTSFEESKKALRNLSLNEIVVTSKVNPFMKPKNNVPKEESITRAEKVLSPISPRPQTSTIALQESKKKIHHVKNKSTTISNQKLLNSNKIDKSSDAKERTSLDNSPSVTTKPTSYQDLVNRLYQVKDQKEKFNTSPDPYRLAKCVKGPHQSGGTPMTNSRQASKSPANFHSVAIKSWTESPKVKLASSDDFSWALCLSPHLKEENSLSEQDLKLISEVQKNPLIKRKFLKISQTANSIFVIWPHTFEISNLIYQLDYGVGSKVQNVEQFRTAYKGSNGSHVISDLMPKTKYRLRLCPILLREDKERFDTTAHSDTADTTELIGEWTDIVNVMTKDPQTIDLQSVLSCATVSTQGRETIVDFEKPGKAVAKNEYEYGKIVWEVKIPQQSAHQSPMDSNSFIKVGVTNKIGKAYNIVGSLINYSLNTESMVIKVFLDLDTRTMTVYTSNNKIGEVFSNLPSGTLYPAFQNKTSKDSNSPLKLIIRFDLPYPVNELKELEL